jgi:hypothetical protein
MRTAFTRLGPFVAIAALTLAFFYPLVLHPAEVLYSDHSDLLSMHVPARRFLVRAWREDGELPLWSPYSFSGSPFVHDIELAAFYPPHAVLYLLPEDRVGAALSWLVVFHVALAGWCMYAYARSQGLRAGAFVAAVGYMFAGRWQLQLLAGGHYILIGLAWLPLLILLLDEAFRRRSLLWATGAGVVSALLVLGTQPQWTFYAGLLTVAWTLGTALDQAGGRGRLLPALARWAGYGAWAAVVGLCLCAVQLLPTVEAASLSTRGASGVGSRELVMGGLRSLLFLVGPALTDDPPQLAWEDRGGLTLLWLLAAALAPLVGQPRWRYRAGVAVALLVYGLGGAYLLQGLPLFRLFRQPARALVLLNFPIAVLAGYATEALFSPDTGPALRGRGRRLLVSLSVATLILSGGFALRMRLQGQELLWHAYWLSLAVTLPAAYALLQSGLRLSPRLGMFLWGLLLTGDAVALLAGLPATRPEDEVFAPSPLVRSLTPPGRVFDHIGPSSNSPLGSGAPLARLAGVESVRGFDPLDYLRYKEYLQFIGGADVPIRPFEHPLAFPIMGDLEIRNKPLLDLLGVRYLLRPEDVPGTTAETGADWSPVARDESPLAFDCCSRAGGRQPLPPYTVYENATVFPRAFVVHRARPMPPRDEALAALTAADLRTEVLLEDYDETAEGSTPTETRSARISDYRPNRVTVDVGDGPAGWLVLADVWYPGWRCRIDGAEVPVRRADFLFRAVPVPAGRHDVVFTFAPESYRIGRLISLTTLGLLTAGLAVSRLRSMHGGWRSRQ